MSITFRYSALNTANYCMQRYKLQYLDKLSEPGLSSDALAFGTAMHLVPETHFEGGDALATFRMYWQSINPEEYAWGRYSYDELGAIGEELTRKWLKSHAQHYEPIHVEKQLEFTVGPFTVKGKPDFIGKYKGVLSVVDWKTSHSDYDKRKALVNSQLWLYAHAAKQQLGIEVEQVVYAPMVKYGAKVQNPICIPYTEAKSKSMLANAEAIMLDLSTRTSYPRNEDNCLRCPYFSHCYKETK